MTEEFEWQVDHSFEDILMRLGGAAEAVRARVYVPSSSRVSVWLSAIDRLARADRKTVLGQMLPQLWKGSFDHPYQDSLRALFECRMFLEIVEQMLPLMTDSDLADLISGNLQPAHDNPSSRARDREFELFIAAICKRSGLEVRLQEPDILVSVREGLYAIAAKRLRSQRRVRKNLQKASKQVTASRHPGFVFADVTQLLDPEGTIVTHWTQASELVGEALGRFESGVHAQTLRADRGQFVMGVVLRAALPLVSEGPRYGTYEHWAVLPSRGADRELGNAVLRQVLAGVEGV